MSITIKTIELFLRFHAPNRIALQALNHVVDLTKFTRDADALWTVRLALATLDAVIRLTVARHDTIQ